MVSISVTDAALYAASMKDSAMDVLFIAQQVAASCNDDGNVSNESLPVLDDSDISDKSIVLIEDYPPESSIEVDYDGRHDTIVTSNTDRTVESVVVLETAHQKAPGSTKKKSSSRRRKKSKRITKQQPHDPVFRGRSTEKEHWEYSFEEISRRRKRWNTAGVDTT